MVIHIITRLAMGGAQQLVYEITKRMHASGENVLILTGLSDTNNSLSAKDNNILNKVKIEGIPVKVVSSLNDKISILKDIKSTIEIYKLIKFYNPSVVHIHSSKTGILARIVCFFLKIQKIIYHVHGWSFSRSKGFSRFFYLFLERMFFYITTEFIFVCKQDMLDFIKYGGNKKILKKSNIIYPGVDFIDFKMKVIYRKRLRKKLGLKQKDYVVGTVGRIDYQKNPQLFIQIAQNYLNEDNNAKFLWIGKGSYQNEIQIYINKMGLSDKFIFTGYVENVEPYFTIFDTFVLTSRYEGLPLTILKAMSFGVPIVAFNINGINDLSTSFESVIGVRPFNIKDFSKALKEAKNLKISSEKLFEKESVFIRKYFNFDTMYNQIIKLYE